MAAIDKTYVSSYEDWKIFDEWAMKTVYTTPSGSKLYVKNYCYYPSTEYSAEYMKELFNKTDELPVMNTSHILDYFIIKECPLDFVQKRMREVYREEYYNQILNGTSDYDTFVLLNIGKHISIHKKPRVKSIRKYWNSYYHKYKKYHYYVDVTLKDSDGCPQIVGYNEELDKWVYINELEELHCSGAHIKSESYKAIIKKILKWNLPVGTEVHAYGRYEEQGFSGTITK